MKKGDSRRSGGARIIATTVDENAALMEALFGCKPVLFRPSIPHLVYQYSVFTNFSSSVLDTDNLELSLELKNLCVDVQKTDLINTVLHL